MTSAAKFMTVIESLREAHNVSYMDAIIMYCEENDMEIETAASIVKSSSLLKARIQAEAEERNYLPKTAKLPIE